MRNGKLVLNVIHGKELEVEYKKSEITDKINSFFGYNCISQVVLKVVQKEIKIKEKNNINLKNLNKINKKMEKISNIELKSSLNNFIKAFNEKNK